MAIERHQTRTGQMVNGKQMPSMSGIVVHGDTIYLAGQVGHGAEVEIKAQTKVILDNIDAQLASVGSNKSKILSANLWITDFANFGGLNEVWNAWIDPDNMPARACVRSELANPDFLIEIMITAAK